eukprot:Selendium_serpulae@DN1551_c0_g1_i1.p1
MGKLMTPRTATVKAYDKRLIIFVAQIMFKIVVSGMILASLPLNILFRYGGIGESLCAEGDELKGEWRIGCNEQNEFLRQKWNYGIQMSLMSGVVGGPLLDALGPRKTGIVGMALAITGMISWMLASPIFMGGSAEGLLMSIGWILVGAAKQPITNCVLSIINLYPSNTGLALSIMNGSTNFSAVVPQLMLFFIPTFSYTAVMIVFILFCVGETFLATIVIPQAPFVTLHEALNRGQPAESLPIFKASAKGARAEVPTQFGNSPGFTVQFLSFGNILFMCYFAYSYWRMAFYNGHVVSFLKIIAEDDTTAVASYASLLSYMIPFGSLGSVFLGWVTDSFGFTAQLLITNTCGIMLSALTLVPILRVQIITFLMFVIYKGNIFGSLIYFISSNFGFANLGKLMGFDTAVSAVAYMGFEYIVSFLQVGMESKMELHYYLIGAGLICYICPLYVWLFLEEREDQNYLKKVAEKARLPRSHRASSIMLIDSGEAGRTTTRILKGVAASEQIN